MKNKIIFSIAIIIAMGYFGYAYFLGGGAGGGGSNGQIVLDDGGSEGATSSIVDAGLDPTFGVDGDPGDGASPGGSAITGSGAKKPVATTKKSVKAVGSVSQEVTGVDAVGAGNDSVGDIAGPQQGTTSSSLASLAQPTVTQPSSVPSPQVSVQTCSFTDATSGNLSLDSTASRSIILNEIAWMGTLPQNGETTAKAGNREWIELKNISSGTIDLSGWQIFDSAGNLKIILGGASASIPPGGFYLLVRDDGSLPGVQTDSGYSGGMTNTGDQLALFDPHCTTADFLDASSGWPGGDNTTKQTLERDISGSGWHTSVSPGGTPRAENSVPAPANSSSSSSSSNPLNPIVPQYIVSVSSIGGGTGVISSTGILCGFVCQAAFASGTKLIFTESPSAGYRFIGWSGACAGSASSCSFVVSGSVSIVADFETIAPPPPEITPTLASDSTAANSQSSSTSSSSTNSGASNVSSINHLLIAAVQIAGASSSNDFVKLYNPTNVAVDISGWRLHKKSNTGTDTSLKTFASGSSVAPGENYVWANSAGGFAASIGADASTTETLSADNSVAVFDANGNIVDQVAWGTGTNQYIEGAAYPTDPTAGKVLTRKIVDGVMVDTDDNASDFTLQ